MGLLLGCIADDFTGATDLANNLVRAGMRVVQANGLPSSALTSDVDAVVIALKSRTSAVAQAVEQSLSALAWLQGAGAKQIYFKYCSTFDSTPQGNIGPVIDALMKALNTPFTIATPAFPENKRTVFKGYLFAGDGLLSESGMQHHPLTPMTDSNLVRVLQAQTQTKVGLTDYLSIAAGSPAIKAHLKALQHAGVGISIVDAISNHDLMLLGVALKDMPLVTGGSGVAIGLPQNFGLAPSSQASRLPAPAGFKAIVSGSCSEASNRQVAHAQANGVAGLQIDPLKLYDDTVPKALDWAKAQFEANPKRPILIYSTAKPEQVKAAQTVLGIDQAGHALEKTLAKIALGLTRIGVKQLIVAGGETSGACVQALGVEQMQIGPQIDPGVPWCFGFSSGVGLHLALKSGNFGTDDFFTKAFQLEFQ